MEAPVQADYVGAAETEEEVLLLLSTHRVIFTFRVIVLMLLRARLVHEHMPGIGAKPGLIAQRDQQFRGTY